MLPGCMAHHLFEVQVSGCRVEEPHPSMPPRGWDSIYVFVKIRLLRLTNIEELHMLTNADNISVTFLPPRDCDSKCVCSKMRPLQVTCTKDSQLAMHGQWIVDITFLPSKQGLGLEVRLLEDAAAAPEGCAEIVHEELHFNSRLLTSLPPRDWDSR